MREPNLTAYDAAMAKIDAEYRKHLTEYHAFQLKQTERLPEPERDVAQRTLRVQWSCEDTMRTIDADIRRGRLLDDLRRREQSHARLRRGEEALSVTLLESEVRSKLKRKAPVDLETLSRYHRVRTEPGAPEIPELRADIDRLASALHVRIYWTVPVPVQAYAWPTLHEIEVSPVVSEEAAAVVAHELGHIAQPCPPTHARVPRRAGMGTLCCACEIEAWTWASMNLCRWSSAMHVEAGRCLRTYRPYASEAEQAAIDRFCGTVSHAEIRLRRMSRNQ